MSRYQINIGSDFPVESEGTGGGRRRFGRFRHPPFGAVGAIVRGLFVLSLAVLAIRHPGHAALVLGAVLLVGRLRAARIRCGGWHRGGWNRDSAFV